ncbi:MAG: hypothetical protein JNL32_10445 [Candidatus Kapabacteria bacterium]|nr:hypothetical protein [Candidatus Kapabacteria bacterium]
MKQTDGNIIITPLSRCNAVAMLCVYWLWFGLTVFHSHHAISIHQHHQTYDAPCMQCDSPALIAETPLPVFSPIVFATVQPDIVAPYQSLRTHSFNAPPARAPPAS